MAKISECFSSNLSLSSDSLVLKEIVCPFKNPKNIFIHFNALSPIPKLLFMFYIYLTQNTNSFRRNLAFLKKSSLICSNHTKTIVTTIIVHIAPPIVNYITIRS